MDEFACKASFFLALTVEIDNCVVVAEIHVHLLLPTTDGVIEHTFVIQQKVLTVKPCSHVTSVFASTSKFKNVVFGKSWFYSTLHICILRTRRQSAKKNASTEVICEWASNGIDPFSTFLLMECVTIDIPYTRVAFKLILYNCKFLSRVPRRNRILWQREIFQICLNELCQGSVRQITQASVTRSF